VGPRRRIARRHRPARGRGGLLAGVGSKAVPLQTVVDAFVDFDPTDNDQLIVRSLRVPRTVIGLLVGAALGLAGAVMQGVTRNPLADPALLGIEAGASLAVVAGIAAFSVGTLSGYVWFALAGAAIASAVVYGLSSLGNRGAAPLKLALAGTAVAALLSSLTSAILLLDVTTLDVPVLGRRLARRSRREHRLGRRSVPRRRRRALAGCRLGAEHPRSRR
jgi:iron complex transport system permease protein